MKKAISKKYEEYDESLVDFAKNFEFEGEDFGNQKRNSLKLFKLHGKTINIKSFRVPNFINQIAYRFFRKSKAERSFKYAQKLLQLGIGTPEPIAYFEFPSFLLFKKSYYISSHLEYDLTFRELSNNFNYPDHENILRAFTRFTHSLHEKGVHFLDHSPGNTLINKTEDGYKFYLVDLNRMEFRDLDFLERIKNFRRLTPHKYLIEIMSDEYAKCIQENPEKILKLMWDATQKFHNKFQRKQRLKKKYKFWRK